MSYSIPLPIVICEKNWAWMKKKKKKEEKQKIKPYKKKRDPLSQLTQTLNIFWILCSTSQTYSCSLVWSLKSEISVGKCSKNLFIYILW